MDRRAVLTRIVQGFSLTGLGFVLYPFIRSFLPVLDDNQSQEVDISELMPGQSKTVAWQGRHLYVVRRFPEDPDATKFSDDELKDPESIASSQPTFAANSLRSKKPDLFIVFKNCTHLGCEVRLTFDDRTMKFDCPCHRSEFDQAGRVHKESIASYNLEVPDYQYLSKNVIKLTESERS
jgi:ubiquinol-cytochrome c reductase iron-sulfur subunit